MNKLTVTLMTTILVVGFGCGENPQLKARREAEIRRNIEKIDALRKHNQEVMRVNDLTLRYEGSKDEAKKEDILRKLLNTDNPHHGSFWSLVIGSDAKYQEMISRVISDLGTPELVISLGGFLTSYGVRKSDGLDEFVMKVADQVFIYREAIAPIVKENIQLFAEKLDSNRKSIVDPLDFAAFGILGGLATLGYDGYGIALESDFQAGNKDAVKFMMKTFDISMIAPPLSKNQ